ncbi:MAG: hypothetical protein WC734_04580 [Patescibacteria group bacterium]
MNQVSWVGIATAPLAFAIWRLFVWIVGVPVVSATVSRQTTNSRMAIQQLLVVLPLAVAVTFVHWCLFHQLAWLSAGLFAWLGLIALGMGEGRHGLGSLNVIAAVIISFLGAGLWLKSIAFPETYIAAAFVSVCFCVLLRRRVAEFRVFVPETDRSGQWLLRRYDESVTFAMMVSATTMIWKG